MIFLTIMTLLHPWTLNKLIMLHSRRPVFFRCFHLGRCTVLESLSTAHCLTRFRQRQRRPSWASMSKKIFAMQSKQLSDGSPPYVPHLVDCVTKLHLKHIFFRDQTQTSTDWEAQRELKWKKI